MAFVKCNNGHLYDNIKHSNCPFCVGSDSEMPEFHSKTEANIPGDMDKTILDEGLLSENSISAPDSAKPTPSFGERTVAFEESNDDLAKRVPTKKPAQGRKLEGFLVSFTNTKDGDYYPLYRGKNIIGRDPACDIVVDESSVSSQHATILIRGNEVIIEDKLSVNGTYINGNDSSIDREHLEENDLIKIGKTVFKIKLIGPVPEF